MFHILHQTWMHIQGSNHCKYLQDKHDWINTTWQSLDWKGMKSGYLSLRLLKQIKTSKSIHGLLNTGRQKSKISPDTQLNCTSVQDVTNQMKLMSTSWSANMWVPTGKDMILFSQYGRSLAQISGNSYTGCEQCIWDTMWTSLARRWYQKWSRLTGTWQCVNIWADIGELLCLQIDV